MIDKMSTISISGTSITPISYAYVSIYTASQNPVYSYNTTVIADTCYITRVVGYK